MVPHQHRTPFTLQTPFNKKHRFKARSKSGYLSVLLTEEMGTPGITCVFSDRLRVQGVLCSHAAPWPCAACPCWHQSLSRSNNLFEIRADRVNELTKQRNLPTELEQRALAGETAQRECAELLLTRASLDQEKLACEARRPPPAARSPPFRRLDRSIDPQRDRSCPMGGNGPSLGRPTRAV